MRTAARIALFWKDAAMLVGHTFDFAIVLRSRRRELRLRQDDLARHAGVSRSFICDLEQGKPSLEFGKVLQVMAAMNVPMSIGWKEEPPGWTKPIIKRVKARERRCAAARPAAFRETPRPRPDPPQDWYAQDRAATKEWVAQREEQARLWSKEEVERFVGTQTREGSQAERRAVGPTAQPNGLPAELRETRRLIVALIRARSMPHDVEVCP